MPPEGMRRSGRIPKEIAILLVGSDLEGKVFSEQTKTVVLSRHGAGIVSQYKLVPEQELILRRLDTNSETEIRAVGVIVSLRSDLANDANFCLAVRIEPAKDQLLFGDEFILRNDARAMEAEHNGLGLLRKDLALQVASDQQYSDLFRNSAASTHAFRRHFHHSKIEKGLMKRVPGTARVCHRFCADDSMIARRAAPTALPITDCRR